MYGEEELSKPAPLHFLPNDILWFLSVSVILLLHTKMRMKKMDKEEKLSTPPPPPLPRDIIECEILPRLPVKSLLRFTSVCKQWQSLIHSDPHFSKCHFAHARRPEWRYKEMETIDHFLALYESSSSRVLDTDRRGKLFSTATELMEPYFAGSCHGLLLISGIYNNMESRIIFWNPYIDSMKTLRVPTHIWNPKKDQHRRLILGLGFDSGRDDYKVIAVLNKRPVPIQDNVPYLYMYSLRRNSWTALNPSIPLRHLFFYPNKAATTLFGRLHWITWGWCNKEQHNYRNILCFDPVTDEFSKMSLPEKMNLPVAFLDVNLGLLNGHICAISANPFVPVREEVIQVWTLKESNVWSKLHSFKNSYSGLWAMKPLGYLYNKEEMLLLNDRGYWVINVKDGSVMDGPWKNPWKYTKRMSGVAPYVETLHCPWLHLEKPKY